MVTFLSILLFLACLIVIGTILLQPAKSGVTALGGSSQSIFGSTGGTTFLFRVTMGSLFFIFFGCLFLSWYKIRTGKSSHVDSVVDTSAPAAANSLANPTAPAAPANNQAAPLTPVAPAAPAAPAGK